MKTDHVSLIIYHLLIQKPSHILIENSISQNQETDTLCNVYYSKNLPISSFQICERKTMKQNHLMLCTNPKTFPYPHCKLINSSFKPQLLIRLTKVSQFQNTHTFASGRFSHRASGTRVKEGNKDTVTLSKCSKPTIRNLHKKKNE